MPRNTVLFDEGKKVAWGVAGKRGLGEVRVGREKILRACIDIGEVASATAGDEDLFARAVSMLEHEDTPPAATCVNSAHEPSSSSSQNEDVNFGHLRSRPGRKGDLILSREAMGTMRFLFTSIPEDNRLLRDSSIHMKVGSLADGGRDTNED